MPIPRRVAAALSAVAIFFGVTGASPAPSTPPPSQLFIDSLKCITSDASDATKLSCLSTIQDTIKRNPLLANQAYPSLVETCFKDPSFFVKTQASRVVIRTRFQRDLIAPQELALFLDPKITGSKECLGEFDTMAEHLRNFTKQQKFSTLVKLGMVDTVWNSLLNGPPAGQKDTLALFWPMLSKGTPKELAPYKNNAEKYFDFLFSADAAKLGAEDLITIPIDQVATILFAMGDTAFVGKHLRTAIESWVLYPNDKQPKALSPDSKWGYADDLNAELRPRLPQDFKFTPEALKIWVDQLEILIISASPPKNARQCIDRATAVENVTFGGPQLVYAMQATLAEIAREESLGKQFGQDKGCGELEAREIFRS